MLLSSLINTLAKESICEIYQKGTSDLQISGFSFLSNNESEYLKNYLYIDSLSAPIEGKKFSALLTFSNRLDDLRPAHTDCWIIHADKEHFAKCMNRIQELLSEEQKQEQDFHKMLYMLINQASLHEIVEYTAQFFNRSIIITDLSFKVIDYSISVPITDIVWKENIERGHCTYEFIKAVNELMPAKELAHVTKPFLVECWRSNEKRLCCTLRYQGQHIGYLAIIDNEKELSPFHYEYLPKLNDIFVHALKQLPIFGSMFVNVAENIFLSLLNGEDSEITNERFLAAGITLPSAMRCFVFFTNNHSSHDKNYLQGRLKALFASTYVLVYKEYVVAVVADNFSNAFQIEAEKISNIKKMGVSSSFDSIKELPYQLNCAVHACHIADKLGEYKKVCSYDSYLFFDLLLSCSDNSLLEKNIHPAFRILHSYDLTKGTDLLKTLQVFIQSDRHMGKTAQQLFIHRNSLKARIDKICSVANIDMNDKDVLFQLICSVKINQLLKIY